MLQENNHANLLRKSYVQVSTPKKMMVIWEMRSTHLLIWRCCTMVVIIMWRKVLLDKLIHNPFFIQDRFWIMDRSSMFLGIISLECQHTYVLKSQRCIESHSQHLPPCCLLTRPGNVRLNREGVSCTDWLSTKEPSSIVINPVHNYPCHFATSLLSTCSQIYSLQIIHTPS